MGVNISSKPTACADYLAASGYDPQTMRGVIRTLKEHEIFEQNLARLEGRQARAYHGGFSTHPDNDTRLREIIDYRSEQESASDEVYRDRFLDEIEGMVFGPNPASGVLIGNAFLHPDLGFALRFRNGWNVSNQPDQLVAINTQKSAKIQVITRPIEPGATSQSVLKEHGVTTLSAAEPIRANGVIGITGLAEINTNAGIRSFRVSALVLGEHAYVITRIARSPEQHAQYDGTFRDVAISFHSLTDSERASARGQHLRVANLRGEINWVTLAHFSPLKKNCPSAICDC